MSTTSSPEKPYTASALETWAWGTGVITSAGIVMMFQQVMNIFTVAYGLSPVVLSWILLLPRIVDAFVDPVIGNWSDQTRSCWGRRKPFLLVSGCLGALLIGSIWWADPGWSHTVQFCFLGVLGVLIYICYGTYNMSYSAIGFELSDDYNERSKIWAISGFFGAVNSLAVGWMYWFALRPMFGNEIWGMRWIGVGMALVMIGTTLITVYFTRERFTHSGTAKHVPILQALKETTKNRPFVILLIIKFLEFLGMRIATVIVVFYVCLYYVCPGNKDLATKISGIAGTINVVGNFVFLPLVKPFSKFFGKRNALVWGTLTMFLAALVTPFVLTPKHPYWVLIPTLIFTPMWVVNYTITNAILPDICDLDELECGQRREGLYTAVYGFVSKVAISLCLLLVGYVVVWAGVDTKQLIQPPQVLHNLYWMAVIPGIFLTFLTLMAALKFPMTEAVVKDIHRQLEARRLARAAAGQPTDLVVEELVQGHPEPGTPGPNS